VASRGKRVYLVQASDADEATDRALDEATRPNWRVKQMRGVPIDVRPTDSPERWYVTLWVVESPH